MSAPANLAAQMADKTNDKLLAMFKQPEDWLPESLEVARAELQRRGVDPGTIRIEPPPLPEGQPLFFAVSPVKLVIMATVTFGVYELYWFYKNWKTLKQWSKSDVMPFWRAFFGVIWCYPFFREVEDMARSRGLLFPTFPSFLAVGWIILCLCGACRIPTGLYRSWRRWR